MAKTAKTPAAAFTPVASVTVTQVAKTNAVSSLETLRVASAVKDGEAKVSTTAYARALVDKFGQNFWRKASPKFKEWQTERAAYDAALKEHKHPNPSQAHTRLISAADAICNPQEPGTPRAKVELLKRAKKESIALYKAFLREEEKVGLDENEKRIFSGLIDYMTKGLKVDLNDLDKK